MLKQGRIRHRSRMTNMPTKRENLLTLALLFCVAQAACSSSSEGPKAGPQPFKASSLALTFSETCGLQQGGAVQCWGGSSAGPNLRRRHESAQQVVAGFSHFCALLEAGTVSCWGDNKSGQLGDGSNTEGAPRQVLGLDNATRVAAGDYFTCAIVETGNVKCWGDEFVRSVGKRIEDPEFHSCGCRQSH